MTLHVMKSLHSCLVWNSNIFSVNKSGVFLSIEVISGGVVLHTGNKIVSVREVLGLRGTRGDTRVYGFVPVSGIR